MSATAAKRRPCIVLYRVTLADGTVREFTASRGAILTCPPEWGSWARFGSRTLVLRLKMRGAEVELVFGQDADPK